MNRNTSKAIKGKCTHCGKGNKRDGIGYGYTLCSSCSDDLSREWARRASLQCDTKEHIRKKFIKELGKEAKEKLKDKLKSEYAYFKDSVFNAYGGYVCSCCGEKEPLFLSIDHVNNDGSSHRRKLKEDGSMNIYKWLYCNDFPEGFQVLCRNCNWGKYINKGICPHKNI